MFKRFLTATLLLAIMASPCAAADWTKPVSTDTYLNVLTYLREKDTDLATMFSAGEPANLASESIRLNRATTPWQFERWTGSAWSAISVKAALADTATSATSATSATNADTLDSQHGSYYTNYVLARFGASTTSGTTDWNNQANLTPGTAPTLLLGNATNGPGPASYFHVFNFEYATKDGSGQITQFAIPYSQSTSLTSGPYMRGRYSGVWTGWYKLWHDGNDGPSSGLAAQTADSATTATTATSAGKWTTARTLSLSGDVTGSASVDGSANAAITATVANDSHTHTTATLSGVFGNSGLTTNAGYVRIPDVTGGTIFQGGLSASIPGDGTLVVTFPTSFPTCLTSVVATDTVNSTGQENSVKIIAASTTSFTLQNSALAATTARWMAIGK